MQKEVAPKILKGLNPDFVEVCKDFEDGYIGFEVVSKGSYLGEVTAGQKQTRGANCTSVDAMMSGILKKEKRFRYLSNGSITNTRIKPAWLMAILVLSVRQGIIL